MMIFNYKAALISTVIVLQACATTGNPDRPSQTGATASLTAKQSETSLQKVRLGKKTDSPMALIAEDFLQAISQVPGVTPSNMTITVDPSRNGFQTAITRGFQKRGFKVVSAQTGQSQLRTITSVNRSNTYEITFTVQLNKLAMKRTYMVAKNFVRPTSSLFVRGVAPGAIRLDDRVFVESFRT